MELKKGQKVFVYNTRHSKTNPFEGEFEITTVGHKWFKLNGRLFRERFSVDTLQHDGAPYSSIYKVYLSLDEYEKEQYHNKVSNELYSLFSGYSRRLNLSTNQIERILTIIKEDGTSSNP